MDIARQQRGTAREHKVRQVPAIITADVLPPGLHLVPVEPDREMMLAMHLLQQGIDLPIHSLDLALFQPLSEKITASPR